MLRALFALIASALAGWLIVQLLAEYGRTGETMIVAYMLVPFVTIVSLAIFLLAGIGGDGANRVRRLGPWLLAGVAALGLALVAWGLFSSGLRTVANDAEVWVALVLAPIMIVAVQWLILRRRGSERS